MSVFFKIYGRFPRKNQYVRDHYDEVMEQDGRIRQRTAAHRNAPDVQERERQQRRERLDRARQMIKETAQGRNGDQASR